MNKTEIKKFCQSKEQELLEKYFSKLIHEVVIEQAETIGDYTKDLPLKIEEEYYHF